MTPPKHSFRKVWAMPCLLALIVVTGLISALLGVRIAWKMTSWIALALPLAVILWFAALRPRIQQKKR